jgi:hypothetical protein
MNMKITFQLISNSILELIGFFLEIHLFYLQSWIRVLTMPLSFWKGELLMCKVSMILETKVFGMFL